MNSLISGDNLWAMWAIVAGITALAFYCEQRFQWGAKISGVLLAMIASLILVNIGVTPTSSPVYDTLGGFILPLAIPLLLFQSNLKKIVKDSGRLFIIFHIAVALSVVGGIVCALIFGGFLGDQTGGYTAVEVGADIGGTVNLVAMAKLFEVDDSLLNASAIIGNLIIIIWTAAIIALPNMKFIRKHWKHEYVDAYELQVAQEGGLEDGTTQAAKFWKRNDISLLDISKCLAVTLVILAVTQVICNFVNAQELPAIIKLLFGNIYLVLTTLTIILCTLFPKFFENIHGATEIGTIMITMWFVQVGAGAKIMDVIAAAPVVLGFKVIMSIVNIGGVMLIGKFLKWNIEECFTASNAALGGPTTAAAYVISKGWSSLIAPATLVGLYGYIIGNYFAALIGNMFV